MAKMLFDPPNFLVLDEPPSRSCDQGDADHGTVGFRRHHAVRLARPRAELTLEGIHRYGGS
jgi:hypothetical protein